MRQTTVFKSQSPKKQIVWAEVYAPMVPDSDTEYMDADGIEQMAYQFMRELAQRQIDSYHNNELVPQACVVESFIAREGDPTFTPGAWVVGIHIPDPATWAAIEAGELNGLSMEALVNKEPHLVEIEIPAALTGRTEPADDGHSHAFQVSYDNNGNFLGGKTDEVNGHSHDIYMGTVTSDSQGHSHRFAHIDQVQMNEIDSASVAAESAR